MPCARRQAPRPRGPASIYEQPPRHYRRQRVKRRHRHAGAHVQDQLQEHVGQHHGGPPVGPRRCWPQLQQPTSPIIFSCMTSNVLPTRAPPPFPCAIFRQAGRRHRGRGLLCPPAHPPLAPPGRSKLVGWPREIAPPGLPRIRTCGTPASGSSSHGFAVSRRPPTHASAGFVPAPLSVEVTLTRCLGLDVPTVFLSHGSMLRCPLPSTGSARVRSPASSVVRGAPTP